MLYTRTSDVFSMLTSCSKRSLRLKRQDQDTPTYEHQHNAETTGLHLLVHTQRCGAGLLMLYLLNTVSFSYCRKSFQNVYDSLEVYVASKQAFIEVVAKMAN